jgi:hypothetical protein
LNNVEIPKRKKINADGMLKKIQSLILYKELI